MDNKQLRDQPSPSSRLSKESSIYRYTLVHKFRVPQHWIKSYLYSLLTMLPFYLIFDWAHIWYPIFSSLYVLTVHSAICLIFLKMKLVTLKSWTWSWQLPWLGLLPKKYVALSRFQNLLFHLGVVGTAFCVMLIPWTPPSFYAACLFLHLWMLVPRWMLLYGYSRLNRNGHLKFEEDTVALYRS